MVGVVFTIISVDNLRNLYEKQGDLIDKEESTVYSTTDESLRIKFHIDVLLFRVVEVHRTDETTATPFLEGAHLSELVIEQ